MRYTSGIVIFLALVLGFIEAADEKLKLPCHVADYIYEHREEYTDDKLPCKYYRCDNGTWVEGYRECVFNGQCYKPGKGWTYGCHKMKCIEDKQTPMVKMYRTIIESPQCQFQGECKKRGASWRDDCMQYTCHFNVTDTPNGPIYEEQILVDAECKWGNKCFKRGETLTRDCQTYKCYVENTEDNKIHRGMRLEERGCYSLLRKKSCIPYGKVETFGCSTYKCEQDGNYIQMVLETYGCENANGTCVYGDYKHNPTPCIQQSCTKQGWVTDLHACSYKKICIPEGDTYVDDEECTTRKCTLTQKGRGKKKRVVMKMEITESGCLDKSGTCRKNDEEWTDDLCAKRVCKTKILRNGRARSNINIVEPACKDADGKCQPIGSTGFGAVLDKIRFNNCSCKRKGRYGTQLTCEKTKEITHEVMTE